MSEENQDTTETLNIDLNELTLGDLEDFETQSGVDFREAIKGGASNMPLKALTCLVWLSKRKQDPNYTLEDARSIKIAQLQGLAVTETPANPQ